MKIHITTSRMLAVISPVVVMVFLEYGAIVSAAETLPLAGTWRFTLDSAKEGVKKEFFAQRLAGQIQLPGTTDEAHQGTPNRSKPSLDGLYRLYSYEGPAWYQRDVDIPATWQGKRFLLFLERAHGETRVWIDDKDCGTQNSLIAPQRFDLGTSVSPGRHRLTICMDNSKKLNLGWFPSILYEGTQTNWNGLVGRLELQTRDPVAIDEVQVFPDVARKSAKVRVRVSNVGGESATVTLGLSATRRESKEPIASGRAAFTTGAQPTTVTIDLPMGKNMRLWDEFSPALYDLQVSLVATQGGKRLADEHTVSFGMRNLTARGTQFAMNGRTLSLRGTLECGIFPRTGYPAMDVAAWQRIYRIIKSYGLNFMRFHSWCPPEAAFAAADLEGVMLQVEGPIANTNVGSDGPRDAFLEQEFLRMVRVYGNHPSFCLMTLGNEYGGSDKLLSRWVDMLKGEDSRHLYSSPSCGQPTANRQFTELAIRGIRGPGTDSDFRDAVAKEDRPLVGHEIGQWTFYPNFEEIKKYDGVLAAKNFDLVRDDLAAKHMLDLAPQIFQATGRQAVLLYKEEIEVLMRTPGYATFSLLDMHDYPGQGTALIGPLDPFWDSKGFVAPETHRQYCGSTVPLLRMKKRTFTSGETFEAAVEVAHFGPKDLGGAQPQWSIRNEHGDEVASGRLPAVDVPTGRLTPLGAIRTSLASAPAPCKLVVSVALSDTSFRNEWDIWVYPAGATPQPPSDVLVVRKWDDAAKAALGAGKKVVLLPKEMRFERSLPGSFLPVFWSPVWFPKQQANTMGILCDPKHPLFAGFPTDFYSNWQWHDLIQNSQSLILDDTPAEFRPIVQVIDNFARNHKLGNVFEARVGDGRLLVCTINLQDHLGNRPAATQFLKSLYGYAASERFRPSEQLDLATLDRLFAPLVCHNTLGKLKAKVVQVDSEDSEHDNVAANVIDGDPNTFWHTRWGEKNDPMPHHLVLDVGREIAIKGITYLPRQDMTTGRIRQAKIYCSLDPAVWGEPVATVQWGNTNQLQTVPFKQPVRTRYLKILVTSEVGGAPFAAIAELDVIVANR